MATVGVVEAAAVVGREVELGALDAWLDGALDGGGRLVLLSGEAGIGKTSLVARLAQSAVGRGVAVAWGRSTEQLGSPALQPWRQVAAALGDATRIDVIAGEDPVAERYLRFESFAGWLVERASAPGLLVILEDIHTADEATLRLLEMVAGALPGRRVLVVATLRGESGELAPGVADAVDALGRLPDTARIAVGGLDRAAITMLLGELGRDSVVDRILEATLGNPLFVTELIRHLRARGSLDTVPDSVLDAVRVRLARRSAGCREVLQVAAVVGRAFASGLVATALDQPVVQVLEALDEGMGAGIVEPDEAVGDFRFVHVLVRDAVEATLGAAAMPIAHRRVALAIEVYDGAGDEHLAAIARHWDAAAVLGDGAIAAAWCERAADAAERRLAWEEAARLYERADELAGAAAPPLDRHRRLLGAARNRLNCDDLSIAIDRCINAAAAVRGVGDPRLLAEAAVLVEGRGGTSIGPLGALAAEALAGIGDDDPALRARLLGQLAASAFYVDPSHVDDLSAAALVAAAATNEPLAIVAAVRARQMAKTTIDGAVERLALAEQIGDAGRRLARPSVAQWEHIWKVDALLELARLPEAIVEFERLRRSVEFAPLPVARWHCARIAAMLAQATGRFTEAQQWAVVARDLFAAQEGGAVAHLMWFGVRVAIAEHTGFDDELLALDFDPAEAPSFVGDLPLLVPIRWLHERGDIAGAHALYNRMPPPTVWQPPGFIGLHLRSLRVKSAIRLGRADDLPALYDALAPYRGYDVAGSGGSIIYSGPVELSLGKAALAMERWDDAICDLETALGRARGYGAPGFAVEAAVELAAARQGRGVDGDSGVAARLLSDARSVATGLGMRPWITRIDMMLTTDGAPAGPLSRREAEVAALVAEGLTNKQIGSRLYLSERTAQNHVQHILTKLGFASRSQIAAWYALQPRRDDARH